MTVPKFVLVVLLMSALTRAASDSASDSLILREIADSLHVQVRDNSATWEAGRVTRLSIFYRGQRGVIPASLGGLDSLRKLRIAITAVTRIPKEIGLLKRLDSIDIMTSPVGPTIPAEIGELPNLRYLRVALCSLKTLPVSLMKLQKLEYLDFSYNRICQVDDSLRRWILATWPKALDNQDTSECAPTGLRRRTSPPGGKLSHGGPLLLGLSEPGPWFSSENPGQPEGSLRFYSPLGRRLSWEESAFPSGMDSRE